MFNENMKPARKNIFILLEFFEAHPQCIYICTYM